MTTISEADAAFFQKRDQLAEAIKHLDNLADAMIWMSGSPSFSTDGDGEELWVTDARPKLFAALNFLKNRNKQ